MATLRSYSDILAQGNVTIRSVFGDGNTSNEVQYSFNLDYTFLNGNPTKEGHLLMLGEHQDGVVSYIDNNGHLIIDGDSDLTKLYSLNGEGHLIL